MKRQEFSLIKDFSKKGTTNLEQSLGNAPLDPAGSFGNAASYIKEILSGEPELDTTVMDKVTNILGR